MQFLACTVTRTTTRPPWAHAGAVHASALRMVPNTLFTPLLRVPYRPQQLLTAALLGPTWISTPSATHGSALASLPCREGEPGGT